jgi:hypothetical protein
MTEKEWLKETSHVQWMATSLGDRGLPRTRAGRRKLRLFACGCCRVTWDILPDDRLRDAVQTAERFADGQASKDDLAAARAAIATMTYDDGPFGRSPSGVRVAIDMAVAATDPQAYSAAFSMTATETPLGGRMKTAAAEAHLCNLLRCVFGNPFRPVAVAPAWRTVAAVALANLMYETRDFSAMPVLADALQDADCEDEQVLGHCRRPGPHARGCWVVDGLLGKS